MTKEEAKQYIRNQIDSGVKTQSIYNKNGYILCYNKSYLRALKMSKINGKPVNEKDFKGGEILFDINSKHKTFCYYDKIEDYLEENYSNDYSEQYKIIEEVFNEYEGYKNYKHVYYDYRRS